MRSSKFGAKIRKLFDAALKMQRESYECAKCGKKKVKRVGYSLWRCKGCGALFAGGAYTFRTEVGAIVSRLIEEYSKMR